MTCRRYKAGEEANKEYFDDIQDTEAFVAANDDMIAVVFRGTKEIADWATNLRVSLRRCPSEWNLPSSEGSMHEVRTNINERLRDKGTLWFMPHLRLGILVHVAWYAFVRPLSSWRDVQLAIMLENSRW